MVRLEAPRQNGATKRQAGTDADLPSHMTRNKSPLCMRAQHKSSSPQSHSLRDATATTTNVEIDFLQPSSPYCIGRHASQGRLTVDYFAPKALATWLA